MRILGIAGSLRRASYNRALLEAARQLAPDGMQIVVADLAPIPLYNADTDADGVRPVEVDRLKREVADADGLLIATPEYNHSVPGVLQNAIDWASRPGLRSPLAGKPAAIIGASIGAFGGARAQQQLKLVLLSTLAVLMPHPGVVVGQAPEKFDASGALVHEPTRSFLAAFLVDFEIWVRRMDNRTAATDAAIT
jgi:chromate reductase, NAD(P)H dehydrogenase (quinone)